MKRTLAALCSVAAILLLLAPTSAAAARQGRVSLIVIPHRPALPATVGNALVDDMPVFCPPDRAIYVQVHTDPGVAYASWTAVYNPDFAASPNGGFFVDFNGVVIATRDPDWAKISGHTPHDEVYWLYVYGRPHVDSGGPLALIGSETHCEGQGPDYVA